MWDWFEDFGVFLLDSVAQLIKLFFSHWQLNLLLDGSNSVDWFNLFHAVSDFTPAFSTNHFEFSHH